MVWGESIKRETKRNRERIQRVNNQEGGYKDVKKDREKSVL